MPVGEAAVLSVAAGCDALLVCWSDEKQELAIEALTREAERSEAFRARCAEAQSRVTAARRRVTARPVTPDALAAAIGGPESRAVAALIEGIAK
jgi:beta-N-acetylhexosaminidase